MAAGVLVFPTLTYTSAMYLNDGPAPKTAWPVNSHLVF